MEKYFYCKPFMQFLLTKTDFLNLFTKSWNAMRKYSFGTVENTGILLFMKIIGLTFLLNPWKWKEDKWNQVRWVRQTVQYMHIFRRLESLPTLAFVRRGVDINQTVPLRLFAWPLPFFRNSSHRSKDGQRSWRTGLIELKKMALSSYSLLHMGRSDFFVYLA